MPNTRGPPRAGLAGAPRAAAAAKAGDDASAPPPAAADVVIVGAGLLGLYAARRLTDEGFSVTVLEMRRLVGGIWSMYANSTSQVNSSEGGYCLKAMLPPPSSSSPTTGNNNGGGGNDKKANRDHSTAAEVLKDIRALHETLPPGTVKCGVKVRRCGLTLC